MTDKENGEAKPAVSSTSTMQAILSNRALTWTIVVIVALIIIVLASLTISAYRQGRKVSIAGIFEIESQPTNQASSPAASQTPANQSIDVDKVAIEDFPGELLSYSSNSFGGLTVIRKVNGDLDYRFDYQITQGEEGYAGIFFAFAPTKDMTEFTNLQVTISFSDIDALCSVYLEDHLKKQSHIVLGVNRFDGVSDDARVEIQGNDRIFTIPLNNNFITSSDSSALRKQSIAGLGFGVNNSQIVGTHGCTIQGVYFLK